MVSCLSRIEALHPLDRYLLELPNLADQLFLPCHFSNLLVLHAFGSLLELLADLVSNFSIFQVLVLDSLFCLHLLMVNRFDNSFVFLQMLLQVIFSFFHKLVHFLLDFSSQGVVFVDLLLLCQNCLFPRQLHLDLLLLDILNLFDVVLLLHFALPSVELTRIFKPHFHLSKQISVLLLLLVY